MWKVHASGVCTWSHDERVPVDGYTPVKGKCMWWREIPDADELYNMRIKDADKLVRCMCFVEGHYWSFKRAELPEDCPEARHCRYFIKYT